jgi:exonuclease VII large subunit
MSYSYDRRASDPTSAVDWVIDNVLDQKHDGKSVKKEIEAYLREYIKQGQAISDFFRAALAEAEKSVEMDGVQVTEEAVKRAVYKGVVRVFFDDAMGPLLADMIANRKYVD